MENGMYAAVKTDCAVQTVFIDQENLEFCHMNKMVKANRLKYQQEQAKQREAAEKAWRAETARKRKYRRTIGRAVKQEVSLGAAMVAVIYGFYAGLVSLQFAVPVLAILMAVACFKAGIFFTRIFRHRR